MVETIVTKRNTCRCCSSLNIELSVPLAKVPLISPNVGVGKKELATVVAPLDNYLCMDCGLNQLTYVVDPSLIYHSYLYRTAISHGLSDHFFSLAETIMNKLDINEGSLIVEFGSNDGTLLSHFKDRGMVVIGVDPAVEIAKEARAKGIPTYGAFFEPELAAEISAKHGHPVLILSNNVMANIDDLAPILNGIKMLLAHDGAYVFETQYALDVFQKKLLDVIYHEHLSLFSVKPIQKMLHRFDLELFDAERIDTKGGSIRFWVQHKNGPQKVSGRMKNLRELEEISGLYNLGYHADFATHVENIKLQLHTKIMDVKTAGGKVAAWGTSVGCAALIHQFELEDKLDFLLDDTPFKGELKGPGYSLPVYEGKDGVVKKPALVLFLAWRYTSIIRENHRYLLSNDIISVVPLPEFSTIN